MQGMNLGLLLHSELALAGEDQDFPELLVSLAALRLLALERGGSGTSCRAVCPDHLLPVCGELALA